MSASLLDSGVYDVREVAHLLGQHPEVVLRWSVPDAKGRPPIVAPSLDRAFSFVDLVSFAIAGELWRRDVPELDIRLGTALLVTTTGLSRPLAHRHVVEKLATSGTTFVGDLGDGWYDLGKGAQGVFHDIIRLDMKTISFDELGQANRWQPNPLVSLDPRVQAGAPCISGTRIPTAVVAAMLESDPAELVADDLDLELHPVLAAAKFERGLSVGAAMAA